MYPRLGMGVPRVTQYGVCCCLPFFVYHFFATGENVERQPRVLVWGIYWDLGPCVYSMFG